jgi:hypothetical protein
MNSNNIESHLEETYEVSTNFESNSWTVKGGIT